MALFILNSPLRVFSGDSSFGCGLSSCKVIFVHVSRWQCRDHFCRGSQRVHTHLTYFSWKVSKEFVKHHNIFNFICSNFRCPVQCHFLATVLCFHNLQEKNLNSLKILWSGSGSPASAFLPSLPTHTWLQLVPPLAILFSGERGVSARFIPSTSGLTWDGISFTKIFLNLKGWIWRLFNIL